MKKRTAILFALPVLTLASGAFPAAAQQMSAEELTRMLNGSPAKPVTPQAVVPRAVAPAPNTSRTAEPLPTIAAKPAEPVVTDMVDAEDPVEEPAAAVETPAGALNAAAIAALPFDITLGDAQITERSAGIRAKIYTVSGKDGVMLMIYAGPVSQFPIYDGEQAVVAGRVTTIINQMGKRIAAEHLFRSDNAEPAELHVWLMTTDGPQAEQAESIAQSVDLR